MCHPSGGLDPARRDRLVEIRNNVLARIAEAEREGWLGEVTDRSTPLPAGGAAVILAFQPRPKRHRWTYLRAGPTSPAVGPRVRRTVDVACRRQPVCPCEPAGRRQKLTSWGQAVMLLAWLITDETLANWPRTSGTAPIPLGGTPARTAPSVLRANAGGGTCDFSAGAAAARDIGITAEKACQEGGRSGPHSCQDAEGQQQ